MLFVHALGVAQQEPICQVQVVCKRQPAGAPHPAALDQSVGAVQPGDQAPHVRGGDSPERGGNPAGGGTAAGRAA